MKKEKKTKDNDPQYRQRASGISPLLAISKYFVAILI
jgi:hypothetical protein